MDVSTIKNNLIKEFNYEQITKTIDNIEPEFIKTQISPENPKLSFELNDTKKTSKVEEEMVLVQDLQFEYSKQTESKSKTFKKSNDEFVSNLITENHQNTKEKQIQDFVDKKTKLKDLYESNITDFSTNQEKITPPKVEYVPIYPKKDNAEFQQYDFRKENYNQNHLLTEQNDKQKDELKDLSQKESKEKLDITKNQKEKKDENKDTTFTRKSHFFVLGATANTAPKPFNFEVGLNFGYENFKWLYPFYFGVLAKPKIAFSSASSFPYHYKTLKGEDFLIPSLIRGQLLAEIGYCLATKKDLDILISLSLGASASTIWNINFASSVASKFYFSFYTEANVGVAYRYLYATITASYDAMLGFNFGGGLGFNIKLGK